MNAPPLQNPPPVPSAPSGDPAAWRVDASTQSLLDLSQFTLNDIEAVRLLLRGGSVIDWRKANFVSAGEVEVFLRVSGFELERAKDRARLHTLHRLAVVYLTGTLHLALPEELTHPESVVNIFLVASRHEGQPATLACAILKVMHIINHLEARELRYRLNIPDQDLFGRVDAKVVRTVEELQREGVPIVDFLPSLKEKSSIITKLLSKRRTLAAEIYDRLRYRIITERYEDLLPTLRLLFRRLFPFNYIVPEESRNDILDLRDAIESSDLLAGALPELQFPLHQDDRKFTGTSYNEFSSLNYTTISFVVDIPLRVDTFMPPEGRLFEEFGPIVYLKTEFQVFDRETAAHNERGERSHQEYKRRQLNKVRYRLTHGDPAAMQNR